jgi:hypothetical protein
MSVLGDFESMRLYRKRALEFEQLADASLLTDVRCRYRQIANHFAELANMVERSDKAKMVPRLEALRAGREKISDPIKVGQNYEILKSLTAVLRPVPR